MGNKKIQLKDKDGNNIYPQLVKQCILDVVYPVGSVYISINNTNPHDLFGGTWQRIPGQYLMAGDPTSSMAHKNIDVEVGYGWRPAVSGTAINQNQMPAHNHMGRNYSHNWDGGVSIPPGRSYSNSYVGNETGKWRYSADQWIGGSEINEMVETGDRGGNQPHDHQLPDYPVPTHTLSVWKRTA